MVIEVVKDCGGLFKDKVVGDKQVVWMSHGDEAVAAVEKRQRMFYGLQYRPEVTHIHRREWIHYDIFFLIFVGLKLVGKWKM